MTLHEKKLNFKTHLVNLASNEQYESWFLEVNPLGEVPVLVDGVKIIPDSKRIIQYVEDNFSNGYKRLLPTDMDSKMDVIALRDEIDSLPVGLITKGAPHHPDFLLNPKSPFLPSNRAFMMGMLLWKIWSLKLKKSSNRSCPGRAIFREEGASPA